VVEEGVVQPLPSSINEDLELQVQPKEILVIRSKGDHILEVLVKWRNLPTCENSWESWNKMRESFPELHLEDKVTLRGVGDDMNEGVGGQNRTLHQVYERNKWKPITWEPTSTHT